MKRILCMPHCVIIKQTQFNNQEGMAKKAAEASSRPGRVYVSAVVKTGGEQASERRRLFLSHMHTRRRGFSLFPSVKRGRIFSRANFFLPSFRLRSAPGCELFYEPRINYDLLSGKRQCPGWSDARQTLMDHAHTPSDLFVVERHRSSRRELRCCCCWMWKMNLLLLFARRTRSPRKYVLRSVTGRSTF